MITAIFSIGQVYGAELWLLYWAVCALLYAGGCLCLRRNRTGRGFRNVLLGLLIAGAAVDAAWALIYYRGGEYVNYGIGAAGGLLIWIPVLLITGGVVSEVNRRNG